MKDQPLPDGWQRVKFGDIAEQVSVRVNPVIGDEKKYIGLEHLDSGSLQIKRWGSEVVLKGQKLKIKKGDILFAKRNAYLKRVAIAPFDGIFSAHGMVIRPRGNEVNPEFLPFFMQSDVFMNRAIAISEGSLSPTIKWKILEKQEFVIPPFDIQKKFLKILTRIEEVNCRLYNLSQSNNKLLTAIRGEHFRRGLNNIVRLETVTTLKGGSSFNTDYQGKTKGELPFIKVSDMNHDLNRVYINHSENWLERNDVEELKPNIFNAGAVIFAKVGAALLLNRRRILIRDTAIDNNLMAVTPNNSVTTDYLYHFLRTIDFKKFVQEGALPSINQKVIGCIEIPLLSIDMQTKLSNVFNELESVYFRLKEGIEKNNILKKSIFNTYR